MPPARVTKLPTLTHGHFLMVCPVCGWGWEEEAHDLYNVCALQCPECAAYLGVGEYDFIGDDNADQ